MCSQRLFSNMLSSLLLFAFNLYLARSVDIQTWMINISNNNISQFNNIWWNTTINSGHASLTLRQDWREQMKSANEILKFNMVRFHGIFDDDVGTVNGINDYSWVNVDKIYKYLISINIKPYVEISYMPYLFVKNNCAHNILSNHYHPCVGLPENYTVWYNFIQQFTQHLVDVFGVNEVLLWKFEIFNEANQWWSLDEYLKFYNYSVTAIKSVNNKFIVGGPATYGEYWVVEFCNVTKAMNIPIDFISTHAYPNQGNNGIAPDYLNSYYDALNKLINQVKPYNLPIYISEYDANCCGGEEASFYYNDNYYSSSFLIYMANHLQSLFIHHSLLKWMAWWEISDITEESGFKSEEFSNYWGLVTIRGTKKPIFRAFELLNIYANNATFKYLSYNMDDISVINNTIELYCIKGINDNHYTVFISNYNLLSLNITNKILNLYISNYINNKILSSVVMYKIDQNNTNPLQTWKDMGSPTYPTEQQLNKLNQSSQLVPITNVNYTQINQTTLEFCIDIPIYGVVVLDLEY
eukprot:361570_1